ncbi:MAG TPA: hypothetical protein VLJ38_11880 [Polyangiaceae bacterium]|nr:hypothetical protein [Polyangiaceae bacterium]
MFAKRPPLLLAFAGGCLSGAALILSGVGAVSLWRGGTPAISSPHGNGDRNEDVVEARVAAVPVGTRERTLGVAKTSIAAEELAHGPAAAHASDEASAEHPSDSGSSVADVLTRLEAAYRQGLVDGARANANHAEPADPGTGAAEPANAAGPHDVPAREQSAATAVGNSPVVVTAAPTAPPAPSQPTVIAVPAPPITVAVITPPADVAPAYPPQALGAGAAPAAATPEPAQSHDGTASVTQNIHIDNLHQGDVYQQLAVMQYMQLFAGSPYGAYGGYAPAPAVPAHHHSTPTSSPFSTPALPVAAPPFPSFLTSLTNPANPYPLPQRHVGRAFR